MLFAVSDLPELRAPGSGPLPIPSVMNGRLSEPGEIDRYRINVEPGRETALRTAGSGTGNIAPRRHHHGLRCEREKARFAQATSRCPEDVFAVQGTSRTSSDPFLNFTVPKDLARDHRGRRGSGPAWWTVLRLSPDHAPRSRGFSAVDRIAASKRTCGRHSHDQRERRPPRL